MDTAFLPADHRDAGSNRVVAVLEELREGFLRKSAHCLVMRKDCSSDEREALRAMSLVFASVADDVACFIQREQRHV